MCWKQGLAIITGWELLFWERQGMETIQILKRKGFLKKLNIEETNNEKTLEVNNEKVKTET